MKKVTLILALMAFMLLGNHLMAQSRLTPEQIKELKEKFSDFKLKLNLSEAQAPKVKAIDSAYFEGMAGLKDAGGPSYLNYVPSKISVPSGTNK